MEKFTVKSTDGYNLSVHVFEVKNPTAVVQIVHGMEEHQERYEKLAEILNNAGLTVVSSDMRGHGIGVKKEDLGFFKNKNGYLALIDDQKAVTSFIEEKFPALPIYIFAHSMGTIITRVLLQTQSKRYQKVILSGYPNYQHACHFGIFFANFVKLFFGAKYKSKVIQGLGVGAFNLSIKNPKTDADWICKNEETVEEYLKDEYCGFAFSCSAFSDLFHLVKMMHKPKLYKNVDRKLPFLLLRGSDDACTGGEKGAKDSRDILRKAGFENISHIDYVGMRHEIINEKDNQKVFDDIVNFFCEKEKSDDLKKGKKVSPKKENKKLAQTQVFKNRYFEFYDDVKSHTHDVYDW
jgi:alpha-beta hydrolase superfamily lysophospholipase